MASLDHSTDYRDWTHLPHELLDVISSKTTDVADYVRFRAVCKPWRSSTTPTNHPSWLPLLLLPYNPDSTERRFLNLSTQKIFTLDLPESRGRFIQGTPNGWLLMVDRSFSISLLNPFTRKLIRLPLITFLPGRPSFQLLRDSGEIISMSFHYIQCTFRFHVFGAGDECFVVLFTEQASKFLYCKVGESAWTMLHSPSEMGIKTVAYHGRQFYVVDWERNVVVWELSGQPKGLFVPSLTVTLNFVQLGLVTFGGDLLLVGFDLGFNPEKFGNVTFYKLGESGELKWLKLEGIGERLLFFSISEEKLLMAVDVSGCRRNSIYMVNPHGSYSTEVCPLHHIEVISVEEGSIIKWPLSDCELVRAGFLGPTWVIPTLC